MTYMNIISKSKPKRLLYIIQNERVYSMSPKTGRLYLTNFIKDDIKKKFYSNNDGEHILFFGEILAEY